MIREVYPDRAVWAIGPEKFEAGTPDVAGAVGLAEAVRYHERIGVSAIRKHERALTKHALRQLSRVSGIRIFGPTDTAIRGGVVSFTLAGIHPHDIAQILDAEGVAVRSGQHCAMPLHLRFGVAATTRASFYLYNTKEEVDALVNGLEKAKKILGK